MLQKVKKINFIEISQFLFIGNRKGNDAKDPGGRIGPYIDPNGDPDLRNLILYTYPCDEGDIFIIVSDGVHDNLGNPFIVTRKLLINHYRSTTTGTYTKRFWIRSR